MLGTPVWCTYLKGLNSGVAAMNTMTHKGSLYALVRGYSRKECACGAPEQAAGAAGKAVEAWPRSDVSAPHAWRPDCPHELPPNNDPYRIRVPDIAVPPLPPSNAKPMLECARTKGPCSVKVPPEPPCIPPPKKPFDWTYIKLFVTVFGAFGLMYKIMLFLIEREKQKQMKPIWQPRLFKKYPYHATDLPPCAQYVIVGTGSAAWAAYESIKKYDKKAKVLFVSKEDSMPYIRPPLSKLMWWNDEPPDMKNLRYVEEGRAKSMYLAPCETFMDTTKFFRLPTGPAVAIASGWCVLRIDPDEHVLYIKTLKGEQPMYYERCLLAPGSKAKNMAIFNYAPKKVRDKTCRMRTIRDLEIAFRRVKAAKRVVVIGGGTIGCELSYHLSKMKKPEDEDEPPLEVIQVVKDKGILGSLLPEYLGEWAREKLKCEGVNIISNTQVYDAFESKDGRLELTLSNGKSIVADYAFVAVGSAPRTDLAGPSFLEVDAVNGGIMVNTELEARTHLYVAGDAASYHSQWKNSRMRVEHIDNAEMQGAVAGANMAGHWTVCNMEPHYWVRLGKYINCEVVGECGACCPIVGLFKSCPVPEETKKDIIKKKIEKPRPCFQGMGREHEHMYEQGLLFYMRDDVVVGFAFWNLPAIEDRFEVATELLRAQPTYKDIDVLAELLGFGAADCTLRTIDPTAPIVRPPEECEPLKWRTF